MKYSDLLKKYTEEYEKYIKIGLSQDDALYLVEKHIKEEVNLKTMSPYSLINLMAGEDVIGKMFKSFDSELDDLITKVSKIMEVPKKELEEKIESSKPSVTDSIKDGEVKIISNTPEHKEFRVTYPNGYYKYKLLKK